MKSMVSRRAFFIAHATTSSGFRRNESNAEPKTDQQRPLADSCGIEAKNIGGGRSQKACWIYSSFLLHADKAANSSASIRVAKRKVGRGQVGQDRRSCDHTGREAQNEVKEGGNG